MVAHFRHEISHFLHARLSDNPTFLKEFRGRFGDVRHDYGEALKKHYKDGPPDGYEEEFVTEYASSHPHEDWAETAAHLIHLVDILDSAVAAGLRTGRVNNPLYDAYQDTDVGAVLLAASEYGVAINHVNRSMGLSDVYPFVLRERHIEKLKLAHRYLQPGPPK